MIQQPEGFRAEAGYSGDWLIPVEQILHYRVDLKQQEWAVGTIKRRFSVLAFARKFLGFKEWTRDFRVLRMLEGREKKEEGPRQNPRQPLLADVL